MSIEVSTERPAYQEYAAKTMAKRAYRLMTLAQRGLYITLRHELWVNESVPADPVLLAKMLGFDLDEITKNLPAVMPFLEVFDDVIRCPELDAYRELLNARLLAKIEGGKRGAATTNAMRGKKRSEKKSKEQRLAERSANLRVIPRD